jgi:hypothetical protein
LETCFHGLAVAGATIAAGRIAVIALLGAFEGAIAALDDRAGAQLARCARAAHSLGLTIGRATVAILLVAIIADFVVGSLHNAVPATRGRFARRAWDRADESALKLAVAVATVIVRSIAVVAIFAWFDALVSTLGDADTGQSRGGALVRGVLNCTGGIAAVVVLGIAVVAHLACPNDPVTANNILRTFTLFGTGPVVFYLAVAIAAVAGHYIAVVAFLNTILIVDTVTATWGRLDLATQRAGAVAKSRAARRAAGANRTVEPDYCAGAARAGRGPTRASLVAPGAALDCRVCAGNPSQGQNRRQPNPRQMGNKMTRKQ